MPSTLIVRRMQPGEEDAVCQLVEEVFGRFVAPEFPPQGIDEFLRFAHPAALATRCAAGQVVLVAEEAGHIVGMLDREADGDAMPMPGCA